MRGRRGGRRGGLVGKIELSVSELELPRAMS